MAFKTEAIVLHARTLKGADRIYEVLTPRDGKISVIAKGAAKSSSKMAGHMQPFAHVRLMIGRGRQDHLAGVETIDSFRSLRESWLDFILASSLVELILRFNVAGQAAAEEFVLLRRTLALVKQPQLVNREKVIIARIFLWKLMALSGWKPNLNHCALCRVALDPAASYYVPVKGFVCGEHGREGLMLDSGLVPFLASVLAGDDWAALVAEAGTNGLQKQWLEISQQYYQDVISQPIQSIKMFSYV